MIDGGVPASAGTAGLGHRFHYWHGASGRRYLFTAVSGAELGDFRDAIVVLATKGPSGSLSGETVMLLGAEGGERAAIARRLADSRVVAFIHLLAPTEDGRRAVLGDLLGEPPASLAA